MVDVVAEVKGAVAVAANIKEVAAQVRSSGTVRGGLVQLLRWIAQEMDAVKSNPQKIAEFAGVIEGGAEFLADAIATVEKEPVKQ